MKQLDSFEYAIYDKTAREIIFLQHYRRLFSFFNDYVKLEPVTYLKMHGESMDPYELIFEGDHEA